MTAKIIPFESKEPTCSFCKRPKSKVKHMVASTDNNKHICDECIKKCKNLIKEN